MTLEALGFLVTGGYATLHGDRVKLTERGVWKLYELRWVVA